jgi:DNA transformation protein
VTGTRAKQHEAAPIASAAVPADASVGSLPGIGPVTRGWLEAVGLPRVGDLREAGAVGAYRRLKFHDPRQVNLNALYALEAALRGCHWLHLPADVKAALQHEAKAIDIALRKSASSRCL